MNLAHAAPSVLYRLGTRVYPDAVGRCVNLRAAWASTASLDELVAAFRCQRIASEDMTVDQRQRVHQRILDDALESVRLRVARRKVA